MRRVDWMRAVLLMAIFVSPVAAAPTQEEVFQSINQHVGSTVDLNKLLPYLLVGVGVIVLLVWVTHRKPYQAVPRSLNHAGKLLKEIAKKVHLRPAETKVLKTLAEEQKISSPLTLLLCPSLLGKAIRSPNSSIDRTQLADLVQRLRGDSGTSQGDGRKDIIAGHVGEDH
jgi:hypothetical protein